MQNFEYYLENEERNTFTSEAMHRLIKQDHRRSREEKKMRRRRNIFYFCLCVILMFAIIGLCALAFVKEEQAEQERHIALERTAAYDDGALFGEDREASGYASIEAMRADGVYTGPEYEHSAVFTVTYYCGCSVCCGKWSDNSEGEAVGASGTRLEPFVSVAVDTSVIPLGTVLKGADGRLYRAEDTGKAIKGNRIDIFTGNHDEAKNLGVTEMDFYW